MKFIQTKAIHMYLNGKTDYSDQVEIGAGWKTFIVWLWANCFYKHRQRKWLKLIKIRKVVK